MPTPPRPPPHPASSTRDLTRHALLGTATAAALLLCLAWAKAPTGPGDPVVLVLSDRLSMGVHASDLLHLGALAPLGLAIDGLRLRAHRAGA